MSRKKWMRSALCNSAAPIVCTGASPQRCCFPHKVPVRTVRLCIARSEDEAEGKTFRNVPRSRSRRGDRGGQSTLDRPRCAKTPYRRSPSCCKLFLHRAEINDRSGREGGRRTNTDVVVGTAVV